MGDSHDGGSPGVSASLRKRTSLRASSRKLQVADGPHSWKACLEMIVAPAISSTGGRARFGRIRATAAPGRLTGNVCRSLFGTMMHLCAGHSATLCRAAQMGFVAVPRFAPLLIVG
jgi:hypothetical protein